jgi:rare lipoprotein A (peptidoglycan hydrolase)
MSKYILTVCTFLIHTLTNNPSSIDYTDDELIERDKEKSIGQLKNEVEVEVEDTINYIKKGGIHSATWYNPHGAKTASGLRFHRDSLTAAYNFSKMHSYLKVTNPYTNESIIVRVTDRMGNKSKNHIDLSKCAFDSIGNPSSGRIKVIVEEISIQ